MHQHFKTLKDRSNHIFPIRPPTSTKKFLLVVTAVARVHQKLKVNFTNLIFAQINLGARYYAKEGLFCVGIIHAGFICAKIRTALKLMAIMF